MGPSLSVSQTQVEQSAFISMLNNVQNECVTATSNKIINSSIVLSGSTVGDITIAQTGVAQSQCTINNTIQQLAEVVFNNMQESSTDTKRFNLGVSVELSKSTTKEEITQIISTSISNLCSAEVDNIIESFTFVIEQSATGNITISQDASAEASCVMNNLSTMQVKNEVDNTTNASTGGSGGWGGTILTIIIVLIVLGVVLGLIGSLGSKIPVEEQPACTPWACLTLEGTAKADCVKLFPYDAEAYCPLPEVPTTSTASSSVSTTNTGAAGTSASTVVPSSSYISSEVISNAIAGALSSGAFY